MNAPPAVVTITAADIKGNSVAKTFDAVTQINYNFFENMINIVDATGSFYFPYRSVATVTHTISAGGVTTIVIS